MLSSKRIVLFLSALAVASTSFAFSFSVPDVLHSAETLNHAIPHLKTAAHTIPHAKAAAATLHHTGFDPLSAYKELLKVHPLPTKMMTGATLAVCGDAIAQTKDKDAEYDKRRAASFAVFDMAYRALQHFSFPIIVAHCHGQYLGSLPMVGETFDASQLAAMEQTLASQLGIVPFLYYPAFFALTGAIQGLNASGAVTRAKENFFPLMKRNLLFWIPVQFVQFGYIQEDLQIPFLSVCGLAWTFILSVSAGSTKNYTPDKEVQEAMLTNSSNKHTEMAMASEAINEEEDVSTSAMMADAATY
mmetsp:Transcript_4673/g.7257  ORF Transcript_4673/g.7257 Transcript_4673/m.7257 type:complete len:302 (+) Transcript_4673:153-1058(+)|eukprot:CAMPEP_0178754006 /NCGR_PEP_ID=MMETSP0744-20121128/11930_1 /TAXON_ID=913974 /ORGANISM="Nitzschia punctata, Strain CCMP561" /LENGTH=301 /DNA_ID=CAMNT_0020407891 /DNA_START=59 /DNA_END=964 /DNA_ORIENTATION=+